MADKYLGKYDRVSADKYDEFLKELGVNMLLRKAATASSPVFEVGVVWHMDLVLVSLCLIIFSIPRFVF